ncbi:extracellular solute-binding protein [Streptomyces sp. TRM66268-LWL]|uniref:Extracellular solute-binding protein n=1 Tax=Streptomyces polyasparticus TaxID=2767826 RepID=A0ABR7SPF8_9ACTN|nr:extracellular solute-binding protein [Streptomyces polyasparticus]MBC9716804.1 extracellular solute-binding protein [Streptomyces polyasparticus]
MSASTSSPGFSRRTLLRAIGAGSAVIAAPALLTACSGGATDSSVGNKGTKLAPWPTYTPITKGPKPDLPGTAEGVQDGFLNYPSDTYQATNDKPGDGSTVHLMAVTYGTAPTPYENNKFWQAVQEALGIKIKFSAVPVADFPKKIATVMAGDDLPDILDIGGIASFPREAEFVKKKMADLSEFLSGDAAKDYPHLANIPTYAWEGMGRISGKIFGVPVARPAFGDTLFINADMYKAAGYQDGGSADNFIQSAIKASNSKRFALGAYTGSNPFGFRTHAIQHGTPNLWEFKDGKMADMYGHEGFKESLEFLVRLHKGKAFHPDSTSLSVPDLNTQYFNGTVGGVVDGFLALQPNLRDSKGAFEVAAAMPYDAGAGQHAMRNRGCFGYTVLKKAPKKRIEMLLRVLDYLASPFGSKEFELLEYGVEGTHFERDKDNNPILTELGITETKALPFGRICDAPPVLYLPGFAEAAKVNHEWQKKTVPLLKRNDQWGLQSATFTSKGASLDQIVADGVTAIVTGRQKVSDWDAIYSKWQQSGGKQAAEEFAEERSALDK